MLFRWKNIVERQTISLSKKIPTNPNWLEWNSLNLFRLTIPWPEYFVLKRSVSPLQDVLRMNYFVQTPSMYFVIRPLYLMQAVRKPMRWWMAGLLVD